MMVVFSGKGSNNPYQILKDRKCNFPLPGINIKLTKINFLVQLPVGFSFEAFSIVHPLTCSSSVGGIVHLSPVTTESYQSVQRKRDSKSVAMFARL